MNSVASLRSLAKIHDFIKVNKGFWVYMGERGP